MHDTALSMIDYSGRSDKSQNMNTPIPTVRAKRQARNTDSIITAGEEKSILFSVSCVWRYVTADNIASPGKIKHVVIIACDSSISAYATLASYEYLLYANHRYVFNVQYTYT